MKQEASITIDFLLKQAFRDHDLEAIRKFQLLKIHNGGNAKCNG